MRTYLTVAIRPGPYCLWPQRHEKLSVLQARQVRVREASSTFFSVQEIVRVRRPEWPECTSTTLASAMSRRP